MTGERSPKNPPLMRGVSIIQSYVKTLDTLPGVYRMLNDKGEVLYVGKARNLRNRVSNYARSTGHSARIARMIHETASMMFLSTRTEIEALLLEQNLIKQLKPRYNVLMRDDKSFPYILVAKNHAFPQIKKHRGKKTEAGNYYGPFATAGAVSRTLNQLQKVFSLRDCSDAMFESRTRPCLQYQIKRCSGPCVGKIGADDYAKLLSDAERFLQGKSTAIQEELATEMVQASQNMAFERAAALRDRIRALTNIQQSQLINPRGVNEADVIALYLHEGYACVQVFFIRANQNWGNYDFFPKTGFGAGAAEIMRNFLLQFYDGKDAPPLVLLSDIPEDKNLTSQIISERTGSKVTLFKPQRGEKADLVEHGLRNARESLARKMSEAATQKKLLAALAHTFEIDKPLHRVEVYDNSHIQGAHAVGGMIVAGPEGFIKSQYRKFTIRGDAGAKGDDFGMMKEVINRRFSRLLEEDPKRQSDAWPDLLLIDGGAGQVSVVYDMMKTLGVNDIRVVGVAKGIDRNAGKEEFYQPAKPAFALRREDPVLYFIQRLRDEAHRWAIGAHRAKRSKAISSTPLDDVPGIGTARKRALLQHFGSAKEVTRAAVEDLQTVTGISASLAQKIHDFFNKTKEV